MRRLLCLLLALCCLLPTLACAEKGLTLRTADTVEEVEKFILLPQNGVLPEPVRGYIRFITLNDTDPAFIRAAWRSDSFNLTNKAGGYRVDYRHMHNRAAYCMALSYLGVDVTPVMMSDLTNMRDITPPYDGVTYKLDANIERVKPFSDVFDTMVSNYLNYDNYSPVVCTFRMPNGTLHTVLIVGFIPSTGGFIICDPASPWVNGKRHYSYKMAWHVMREVVLSSTFYDTFYGSQVEELYQWRLVEK